MAIKIRTEASGAILALAHPDLASAGSVARASRPSETEKPKSAGDLGLLHRVHGFLKDLTEPGPLFVFALAAPAFSLTRNGAMGWLLQQPAGFLTRGLGLKAAAAAFGLPFEILTYSGAERAYQALHQPGTILDWSPQALSREWGALGLTFGLFKVHGRLARSLFPAWAARHPAWVSAAGMYSGIAHSRLWENLLGWHKIKSGEELLIDSAKTFLQLRTMGPLSQRLMGRRYGAWMESLEAKAERVSQPIDLGRAFSPWGEGLQAATPEGNTFAMVGWKPKEGKKGPEPAPQTPRPLEVDPAFVRKMAGLGWKPEDGVELDRFITYFFSQPENQTGRCYPRTISVLEIKTQVPKVIHYLYGLEMQPERQKIFLLQLLGNQRFYSKEILELVPPLVVKMQGEDNTPEEILKFFREVNEKTDKVFEHYAKETPNLAMFRGHGGWDYALNYLRGALPTPLLPPPPSRPPPSHPSLTSISPPPSQPVIIFTEPRRSVIPMPKTRTAATKAKEGPPTGLLVKSPEQLTWEPKIMDSNSWYFHWGFWHYRLPRYESLISMGKGLSRVPLRDKIALSTLEEKHAVIVRHVDENRAVGISIRALNGDVTLKRLTEVIHLRKGEKGDFGEGSWLVPGDIIQLTPEIELIFDHPDS